MRTRLSNLLTSSGLCRIGVNLTNGSIFDGASPRTGFPIFATLPWLDDPVSAQAAALDILKCQQELSTDVARWLVHLSDEDAACAGLESRSTTTHHKWFLGGGEFSGRAGRTYTVWLHDYFAPETFRASVSFAASVHNHRYGFASRLLDGGMDVIEFEIRQPAASGLMRKRQYKLNAGDTMSITHEDVHQIIDVESHTRTLLVQGPAMRSYSTIYHPEGFKEIKFGHHALFNQMRGMSSSQPG